jgi:predicted component of type VI protein secretion system
MGILLGREGGFVLVVGTLRDRGAGGFGVSSRRGARLRADFPRRLFQERSIVNYGLPDIANRTAGEVRTREMKIELRDSLLRYEPRLLKRGMEITESGDKEDGKISFLVRAEMRADPVPTSVEFVTDIEFDTGEIRITRL